MPSPNLQSNRLTPNYQYNSSAGRYIKKDGTFVAQKNVVRATERVIKKSQANMQALSEQLKANKLSVNEWRTAMLKEMNALHLAQAMVAKGGFARMTQADYGRVGGKLRFQQERLNLFASQVQYGSQKLDGRFDQRVKMYAQAGRGTFAETVREEKKQGGYTLERRVLGAADHCPGCLAQAAKGWQPIGTLDPIGAEECKTNCYCEFEYKVDESVKTPTADTKNETGNAPPVTSDDWRDVVEITSQVAETTDELARQITEIDFDLPETQTIVPNADLRGLYDTKENGRKFLRPKDVVFNDKSLNHLNANQSDRIEKLRPYVKDITRAVQSPDLVGKQLGKTKDGHRTVTVAKQVSGNENKYVVVVLSLAKMGSGKDSNYHLLWATYPTERKKLYRKEGGNWVPKAQWKQAEKTKSGR